MTGIPYFTESICNDVAPLGAMVVASPGTAHVTVVHDSHLVKEIDKIINESVCILSGERISDTHVKVFEHIPPGHNGPWAENNCEICHADDHWYADLNAAGTNTLTRVNDYHTRHECLLKKES